MAIKLIKNLILDKPIRNNGATQTNSYVVIHNTAGGTAKSVKDYFKSNTTPSGERYGVFTHYVVDDKEIYQLLEDNWGAQHCGEGGSHYAKWGDGVSGISNSNSIGIEIADGPSIDHLKAIENAIELTRFLMKTYNVTIVRHGDVADKGCPATIMKLNKWNYFVEETKKRNESNKAIDLDLSQHTKASMTAEENSAQTPTDNTSGGKILQLTFHNTTTVQESLPNANTSDNWVDMHKIKGITLHMYPPYHNCSADSMVKKFKSLNWKTDFHYKVDKDTKIDFSKKPVSGQTTGGNVVGTSESDFEVKPKDPLFSGVILDGAGNNNASGNQNDGKGDTTPLRIYNYCKSQGCTDEAAAGIIANCECECHFDCTLVNPTSGASGLFQWLKNSGRFTSLSKKAKAANKEWTDVDTQIKHMWDEFAGEESTTVNLLNKRVGGLDGFKSLTDAYKAGYEFGKCFERGGGNEIRGNRAKQWLTLIKSNSFDKCADGGSLPSNAIFSTGGGSSSGDVFGWPIPGVSRIPSGGRFGDPRDGGARKHKGIDISCSQGTEIHAYAAGKVVVASYGYNQGRGNYVKLSHESGCYTWYEHIKDNGIKVKTGDTVSAGQVVGLVGNTGASQGAHLHFEIWKNNNAVDPLGYVTPGGGSKSSSSNTNTASTKSTSFVNRIARAFSFTASETKEPFGWPVPGQEYVQSYYGYRTDVRGYAFHPGIDIVAYSGSGAYCYADGTVEKVEKDTPLSGYVKINHGNGVYTTYASLDNNNIYVKEKDEVIGGQCIGLSDKTLYNGLMHLHFEMWIDGQRVDPLIYVKPGKGNKKIPESFGNSITTFGITGTNEDVTWDNIDKGKIVFASHQNKQHTYIDANLFNNQHPKYTLSIGAFFYDEYDLIEKSKNISWPNTEKKLIEQCAKALYDEGFTSEQLWREFDLNRAPSPFLYLDEKTWIEFCKQVDEQVEWLNKKYGKVTSTYIPNNLLTDQNDNEFIETAPDGGIQGGSGGSGGNENNSGSGITTMEKGLFIGDSWGEGIESYVEADKGYSQCKRAKNVTYFYNKSKGTDRIKGMPNDAKFVYIYLGINDVQQGVTSSQTQAFLSRIKEKYPSIPVFVGKIMHMSKNELGEALNKKLDKYNKSMETYCKNNGFNFVTISNGLLDSNGYMKKELATSDGIHLKDYSTYYNNIKDAIMNANISIPEKPDDGESDNKQETNVNDNDIQAESKYKGKYAWVGVYNSCKLYKGPDTSTTKLTTLEYGDEVHIIGANGIFYQVTSSGKAGYVRAKNICIIKSENKYGYTYQANKGKTATLLPGTALYHKPEISDSSNIFKTFSSRKSCTIIDTATNFYYVKVDSSYGYVKAYRCRVSSTSAESYLPKTYAVAPTDTEDNNSNITNDSTANKDNIGKYCYYGNTESGILYEKANIDSNTTCGLNVGDELLIKGTNGFFYEVTFNKKTGFVKSSDVAILSIGHGSVNENKLKQNCFIKWDDTDLYEDKNLSKTVDVNLIEADKGVIVDLDKNLGIYKVLLSKGTGWIKSYCLSFDYDDFRIEQDLTNNELTTDTPTDEGESTPDTMIEINGGDFNDSSLAGWEEEGTLDFTWIENPEWAKPGHWPYRGDGFARIRNINEKLAGVKHEIVLENTSDKNFYLRVLLWVKQVTQDDETDGPTNPNTLKSNGLYIKILDKNNKVKHEKKISLTGLTQTTWSRVGCLFSDVDKNETFKIFIGNKNKYDLYIDDLTIEKVYKDSIDNSTGESNTSSSIDKSGVGNTAIDNGGTMVYEIGKPSNSNASQPEIKTIVTQKKYEEIMKNSTASLIDLYTNSFEPYDKGLEIAKTIGVTNDMRLENLTESINTFTDNIIRYRVTETGPGSIDHCVKPVDELSVLYKNTLCLAEPVYPDLVIPPKYTTSDYDIVSKNSLPLLAVQKGTTELSDALNKSFSYDYSLLEKKTKKSSGKPINYNDPYPYDDKIHDLENHHPKVLIDEIESRLYTCNHPGSPLAQEMAKNFGMLSDMAIQQSKVTEQRLVRIENTLSTVIRNIGRMGSRMNINCVYYGGQDVFGKYKTIRCLHDDRVHDGCSVTLDQCLCCTRYEPIIGQIYDILDETGFNGSAILDDMQMSYMQLDDFKNLNDVSRRSSRWDYIDSNKKQEKKPISIIDKWKAEDKASHIANLKKSITDKKKFNEAVKNIKEEDYIFKMDWTEDNVDLHTPDIKPYPTEKIAAKYKNQYGDPADNNAPAEQSTQLGDNKEAYNTIANSEWVDTRKTDDTIQKNIYSSFDFYFEKFNLNRTGYEYDNGLKGNVGLELSGGNSSNLNGAECRKKICDTALAIVEQHKSNQACYSNSPRTIDFDKPQRISGTSCGMTNPIGYDCTSLVSCCYKAAGLSSFYNGRTGQGNVSENTLVQEVLKKGGKIWYADEEGMKQAMPGDVVMSYKNGLLDKDKIADGSGCKATHAMIYMGDGKVAHSSLPVAAPDGILYEELNLKSGHRAGRSFFIRPQELIDADLAASNSNNNGANDIAGEIDGVSYVYELKGSKCTQYKEGEGGFTDSLGNLLNSSACNTVASHNLPFGTKVYIPALKNKSSNNPSAIFKVTDNGNAGFDFDICCPSSVYYDTKRLDVYVVSWPSDTSKCTKSHTWCIKNLPYSEKIWKDYVKNGGSTVNCLKFQNEDSNIRTQSFWTKYQ